MGDLEPSNYLFSLHDTHVYVFNSFLITVVVCVSSFFILICVNTFTAKLNFVSI